MSTKTTSDSSYHAMLYKEPLNRDHMRIKTACLYRALQIAAKSNNKAFFLITWFKDLFSKKTGSDVEKKKKTQFFFLNYKIIGSEAKKKEKRPSHQEEVSGFFINYQTFFIIIIFFYFDSNAHQRGKKKRQKQYFFFLFFLKMAEIQVGGICKPRKKKKKKVPNAQFNLSILTTSV